jgi:hypothetical protein
MADKSAKPDKLAMKEGPLWARLTSHAMTPAVVSTGLFVWVALLAFESAGAFLLQTLVYLTLTEILPGVYIVWMVRRGSIGDVHIRERRQRYRPFALSVITALAGWLFLRAMGAGEPLVDTALFNFAAAVLTLTVTFFWQISKHGMIIAGSVTIMGILHGAGVGLLLSPLVALVAAARYTLRRHTPAQLAAGIAAGVLLALIAFSVP